MNRRSFVNNLALGTAAVAFFSRTAQAQIAPGPTDSVPAPTPNPALVRIQILNNHGHTGLISYEDVIIGDQITLEIQGSAHHPHKVVLTEADLETLRKNLVVDVTSSMDAAHSHVVRVTRDAIV